MLVMNPTAIVTLVKLAVIVVSVSSSTLIGKLAPTSEAVEISPGDPLQTIIDQHEPGTSFVLMSGIYRLAVIYPRDGDIIQGMPGAILNGAKVLTEFTFDGQFWVASGQTQSGPVLDRDDWHLGFCQPGYERCIYPEDVFFEDRPLRHVTGLDQMSSGTWFFDYANDRIYLADDPTGHLVETSVESYAIAGSGQNVTIRDLVIEKYASTAQAGAIQANGTSGWHIENVTVQLNHGAGLRIGSKMQVVNSQFVRNGQLGIGGEGDQTLIEGNEIAFNNYAHFNPSWEAGGVKFVRTRDLQVKNNYIHDNLATGLWIDIDNVNSLIEDNLVTYNSRHGIFHEISYSAVIQNNVVMFNGQPVSESASDIGVQILLANSSYVKVNGNRIVVDANAGDGIDIGYWNRNPGPFGPHISADNDVSDNLIIYLGEDGRSGFTVEDDVSLQLTHPLNNYFDKNTYYVTNRETPHWVWGGGAISWVEMHSLGQEINGSIVVYEAPPEDLISIPRWSRPTVIVP